MALVSNLKSEADSAFSFLAEGYAQANKESYMKHGLATKRNSTGKKCH